MKHTVIAACLLALVLLAIVINGIIVRDITDELYNNLSELPVSKSLFESNGEEQVGGFYDLWRQKRHSLSLSVHEDELDRVDEAAAELFGAAKSGDFETYCAARERLMIFIPSLSAGEKLKLINIL